MKLLSALDDRVNPVLVKEVRQSLRGKQFKISFWFTVCGATAIGIAVMLIHAVGGDFDPLGARFLVAIFSCMAAALLLFVPVMAFFSMGAEWDENTYDLLVLSDLRPRSIVGGKLLSAGVQALLFLSAFGPFLVFSFLLRGVDLVGLCVSIVLCLAGSLCFSSVAICLSSLTSVRFARVVLLIALVAAVCNSGGMLIAFSAAVQFEGILNLTDPDQLGGLLATLASVAVVGWFAFATACSQLAHSEENRSTGLRVLSTVSLLGGIGLTIWWYEQIMDLEFLAFMTCAMAGCVALVATIFATEAEGLGRRTALRVPRSGVLALLCAPFLPGGGRGVLLTALHAVLLAAGLAVAMAVLPVPGTELGEEGGQGIAVFAMYLVVYVLLPAAALAAYTGTLLGRVLVRVSILLGFLIATFLPALLGFFLSDRTLMEMKHPGHPFWVMSRVWEGEVALLELDSAVALILFACLALAANTPRVVRGLLEVMAASRARGPAAGTAGGAPPEQPEQPEPDALPQS